MQLKYLFTAYFADGSQFIQPADDKSTIDPEKRSSFYDVLKKEEEIPLIAFQLQEVDSNGNFLADGHIIGVDLLNGSFVIGKTNVLIHDFHTKGEKLRLIFFRQHKHDVEMTDGVPTKEVAHNVSYNIGWQTTVDGTNHQRVMRII